MCFATISIDNKCHVQNAREHSLRLFKPLNPDMRLRAGTSDVLPVLDPQSQGIATAFQAPHPCVWSAAVASLGPIPRPGHFCFISKPEPPENKEPLLLRTMLKAGWGTSSGK